MRIFWSDIQLTHVGGEFVEYGRFVTSPETPARAEMILTELRERGYLIEPIDDFGLAPILAVHDPNYVEFLRCAHEQWRGGLPEGSPLFPNVHPRGSYARRPAGPVGLLGWHTGDMACEINECTWPSAYAAAQTAATAARAVLDSLGHAYALCRPPGHHAGKDRAMGFCYLNNAAIAAESLRRGGRARVAILDIDVHHGNGTQEIFYDRGDVFFASLHGDPAYFYPFYWGYTDQTGVGAGTGTTLNCPYPVGSGNEGFLASLVVALDGVRSFSPEALVLSLGTDAFAEDPHGRHRVDTEGFLSAAELISQLQLPTVIVQEGGYPFLGLGRLTVDILDRFTAAKG